MKFDTKMQRMRDRLDAITFVQRPPTLSMKIIGANDPQPEFNQWELVVRVEEKDPDLLTEKSPKDLKKLTKQIY